MPLRAFLAKAFKTTHERDTFADLVRAALRQWEASDELVVIIGNANLGSLSPDALILKQDALIVADFKNFAGAVIGSENGTWTAGGAEVKGRTGGANPFDQIRDYKIQLKRTLSQHFGDPSIIAARTAQTAGSGWQATYLDHIAGLAIFRGPIQDRTSLDPKTRTWFKVADETNAIAAIANMTSRLTDLSATRLIEIAELLSGTTTEYVPPGTGLRAPAAKPSGARGDSQLPRELEAKLAEVRSFVGSTDQLLVIKGMVGTGLDLLIDALGHWFEEIGASWRLLAPSRRLSQNYGAGGESLYSVIYSKSRSVQDEIAIHELIKNEDSDDEIYVVSDAHLVSHSMYKTDVLLYGTGRLLDDLLTYADLAHTQRKVIFVGDPFSLTRGKATESALAEDFVRSLVDMPVCVTSIEALLPGEDRDPIIRNCVAIGRSLQLSTFTTLSLISDDTTRVRIASTSNAATPVIEARYRSEPADVKYLAFTNRAVHDFNKWVRQAVFGRAGVPAVGDIVEFYQRARTTESGSLDNHQYIAAGTFAEVLEYQDNVEAVTQSLQGREEPIIVRFSKVTARLIPTGQIATVLAFRDFILDEVPVLHGDYLLALRVAAKIRARENLKVSAATDRGERKFAAADLFASDPYVNAAKLRFGYALTVRHALGRRFRTIIANCDMTGLDTADSFRFLYSLFAATADDIIVINPPELHVLSNAVWSLSQSRLNEMWKPNPKTMIEVEDGRLRDFYLALKHKLQAADIDITFIEHNGTWREIYHLVSDAGCAKLRLDHNMTGRISTICPLVYTSHEVRDRIREALGLK